MMQAAVFNGPDNIEIKSIPVPHTSAGEVLVDVRACGICGTDLRIASGGYYATYPVVGGHEFSGMVVEVGQGVTHLHSGDQVAINPNRPCRKCTYCYRGKFHLCENSTAVGVTYNGGFAEYCGVKADLALKLPGGMNPEFAAMMEPLSCCLHGIDLAQIIPGDSVIILGGGSIGLLLLQLARNCGAAQIIVSEPNEQKRNLALQLGADVAVDPTIYPAPEFIQTLKDMTFKGADVVIEAVGCEATLSIATSLARRGGTVLFFGVSPQELQISISPYQIFHDELTIRGAFTNPLTDTRALRLLASGRIQVEPLISHRYSLCEITEGIRAVRAGETVKALIIP